MDSNLSRETLSRLYRFALLLAGSATRAEWILARIFEEFATQIGQFRTEKHRMAFLVAKIRESAVAEVGSAQTAEETSAEGDTSQSGEIATRFSRLPEPSKSALALFYLDLFPVSELATFFNLDLEELGGVLRAGRDQLGTHQPGSEGEERA